MKNERLQLPDANEFSSMRQNIDLSFRDGALERG
jgi:hypothetical protein